MLVCYMFLDRQYIINREITSLKLHVGMKTPGFKIIFKPSLSMKAMGKKGPYSGS